MFPLYFLSNPKYVWQLGQSVPRQALTREEHCASGVCVNSLKNLKATVEISGHSLCWHLPELSSLGDLSGCILHLYRKKLLVDV